LKRRSLGGEAAFNEELYFDKSSEIKLINPPKLQLTKEKN